jgi:probable phosphoglycerate mutase
VTARVIAVRHGQSEGNVARIWTSAVDGYPLTELGRQQARAVGERLVDEGVQHLYSSPLPRARQTAEEIGAVIGLEPAVADGFEEFDVGHHEGEDDEAVGPLAIEVFSRWWRDDDLTASFTGGETGHQIVARVRTAFDILADRHDRSTTLVVSHGGSLAVGLNALCENLDALFVSQHILANCDVVDLVRDDDGTWRCTTWAGIPC